eukprot:1188991-Prorocentrum_minimum.AAC.1
MHFYVEFFNPLDDDLNIFSAVATGSVTTGGEQTGNMRGRLAAVAVWGRRFPEVNTHSQHTLRSERIVMKTNKWPIRWVENKYAYCTTYYTIIRRTLRVIQRIVYHTIILLRSILSRIRIRIGQPP